MRNFSKNTLKKLSRFGVRASDFRYLMSHLRFYENFNSRLVADLRSCFGYFNG